MHLCDNHSHAFLQRAWAQNESLRKSTFYDVHTVGAFNAFAQKTKSQGLIKMLKVIMMMVIIMTIMMMIYIL